MNGEIARWTWEWCFVLGVPAFTLTCAIISLIVWYQDRKYESEVEGEGESE